MSDDEAGADDFVDPDAEIEVQLALVKQKFLADALHVAEEEAKSNNRTLSREAGAGVGELAWCYAETVASDLLAFAAHAGRKTVQVDDVVLSARRNPSVAAQIREAFPPVERGDGGAGRKRKAPGAGKKKGGPATEDGDEDCGGGAAGEDICDRGGAGDADDAAEHHRRSLVNLSAGRSGRGAGGRAGGGGRRGRGAGPASGRGPQQQQESRGADPQGATAEIGWDVSEEVVISD